MRHLAPGRAHVVRDSKTPSGPVPISGLRGPIISDALFRTFKSHGLDVRFVYTIDDYDPMDSQSMKERAGMAEHMGKPLCMIPSPDPSVGTDFADYHATRFIALFAGLGITPEFHRMRDLYRAGELDQQIDVVLRNAETIREVHKRIANVEHPEGWLPVAVICENCGRIGTTLATDYDGKTVAYECKRDYVEWAEGCGHKGRISPFKGNAKLPLERAVVRAVGSLRRDVRGRRQGSAHGGRITRALERDLPRGLQEGAASRPPARVLHVRRQEDGEDSKGIGAEAVEIVAVYPPELVRFLMLRTPPKRHLEFDPTGMTLPRLMDEYDRAADAFGEDPRPTSRRPGACRRSRRRPRRRVPRALLDGRRLAADPEHQAGRRGREGEGRAPQRCGASRAAPALELARAWLERWAPDEAKFQVQEATPAVDLTPQQRRYLSAIKALIGTVHDADEMQNQLYEVAKEIGLLDAKGKPSRDAFAAIYLAFIGKPNGPRAGWLLLSIDPERVRRRLDDLGRAA